MRRRSGRGAIAILVAMLSACAGANLWTDLGSVSTGTPNAGRLRHAAALADEGPGWRRGERWSERGFRYGVDELVRAVRRAAERVRAADRRAVLGVADFSELRGGPSRWHNSHESGRDVDLLFYTVDGEGRPLPPPEHDMIRFDGEGKPFASRGGTYRDTQWEARRFDAERNWRLIEALLTDPSVRVQWIFISEGLKARLLGWAEDHGRPRWLVEYGRMVLRQPADSRPHDDHFHIRVYCSRSDRFHGCIDLGVVWQHEKKTFKYQGPERYDPVAWRQVLGPPAGPY